MKRLILPALLLALTACGASESPPRGGSEGQTLAPPAAGAIEGPDPRVTLQRWAEALEARDWEAAYDTWGDDGAASGMDAATYADTYEDYRSIHITIGEGHVEGAAGSLYYEADVAMSGVTQDGHDYRFAGPVTLRRVNDVPGASEEQLQWHIIANSLAPISQ